MVVNLALITLVTYQTTRSDIRAAGVFAVFLFILNLLYADVMHDLFHYSTTIGSPTLLTKLSGKVLFSAIISYTIYYFSKLNVRMSHQETKISELERWENELQVNANELQAKVKESQTTAQQLEKLTTDYRTALKQNETLSKQLASQEAREKLEEIKRTLYRNGQNSEVLANINTLNGRLSGLSEQEKSYHKSAQGAEMSDCKMLIIN